MDDALDEAQEWAIKGWVELAETIDGEYGSFDPGELERRVWGESKPPTWLRQAVSAEIEAKGL